MLTCATPLRGCDGDLLAAFESGPEAAPRPGAAARGQGSDLQLLQAWDGSDRRAFDELDRRYRPRVRGLATSMGFSGEDAEEIAQDTLLDLFLGRRTFRGACAPDQFISCLAASSVLSRLRGEHRQTRLRFAVARAAVALRAERECGGQPDEGLVTLELAARADAAIRRLPDGCRRAFWQRAVLGQSAQEAAAALEMPPSMVDESLTHARRLLGEQL